MVFAHSLKYQLKAVANAMVEVPVKIILLWALSLLTSIISRDAFSVRMFRGSWGRPLFCFVFFVLFKVFCCGWGWNVFWGTFPFFVRVCPLFLFGGKLGIEKAKGSERDT